MWHLHLPAGFSKKTLGNEPDRLVIFKFRLLASRAAAKLARSRFEQRTRGERAPAVEAGRAPRCSLPARPDPPPPRSRAPTHEKKGVCRGSASPSLAAVGFPSTVVPERIPPGDGEQPPPQPCTGAAVVCAACAACAACAVCAACAACAGLPIPAEGTGTKLSHPDLVCSGVASASRRRWGEVWGQRGGEGVPAAPGVCVAGGAARGGEPCFLVP